MKEDLIIPDHELEITTSRSGGPGGQHVNKSDTRVSVRWNIKKTSVLSDKQKERVLEKLKTQVTSDGDVIISNSASRSQLQNKKKALELLTEKIKKALVIPKKRMKTKISKHVKESRLQKKKHKSMIKKMRDKPEY